MRFFRWIAGHFSKQPATHARLIAEAEEERLRDQARRLRGERDDNECSQEFGEMTQEIEQLLGKR